MNIDTVIYLTASKIKYSIDEIIKKLSVKLICVLWKVLSVSLAMNLSFIPFRLGFEARRDRIRSRLWGGNLNKILGVKPGMSYSQLQRRRVILSTAVYHGEKNIIAMMTACAEKLTQAREAVIGEGYTPIFAPLHICSDALATITAAMALPRRAYVYSVYQNGDFGDDDISKQSILDIELIQYHPNSPAVQQRKMLRELRTGKANVIIFPDILPQCTAGLLGREMRAKSMNLFGRQARLHSGAEELARMTHSLLIPFYIYWHNNKIEIRIFEPCRENHTLWDCIELALKEKGDQWLLWHFPSIFYFNDSGPR